MLHAAKGVSSRTKHIRALINEHTNMNTAPPSSCSSKNYVSIDDMESATLLPKSKDDSMIGKKNPSSNNVSLKNVAYGLGIVALACSGSFVAGRSAAQYKLSSASSSSQLGVARLGGGSKASSVKHSTAHSAAAAKKAKTVANVGEEEDKASSVEETQPADPDTMSKEEMAEEIKQLRGYMTSLVGDDDREVYNVSFLFPLLGDLSPLEFSSRRRVRGIEGGETFLFDDDSSIIYSFVCC